MKRIISFVWLLMFAWGVAAYGADAPTRIAVDNVKVRKDNAKVRLTADVVLDSLKLGSTRQLYLTPVISDVNGNQSLLPSVLINGRVMQIAYDRKTVKVKENIAYVVKRNNGKKQIVDYLQAADFEEWMMQPTATVEWIVDSCGCGKRYGSRVLTADNLDLNPAKYMKLAYVTPKVTALPVSIHEGAAKVLFEVNKTVLHAEPYKCRNGQLIDNRHELSVIDDSVSYALKDPNVEIAEIKICGYASPEGTYENNSRLSTGRSRALAEYLAERYKLPAEKSKFDAVPENWIGLRKIVETTDLLNDEQRKELIAIIDRPCFGPADYDAKDKELKTDPRFAQFYKTVILPQWYPSLRETKFEISTRLKPASDEKLAEIIRHTPEKMTLNQMFRVAKLYDEGTPEFNEIINIALKYYPEDETANLNAAIAALNDGDKELAAKLLEKAGNAPEANNARGVVECHKGNLEKAAQYFRSALPLGEAAANLEKLTD